MHVGDFVDSVMDVFYLAGFRRTDDEDDFVVRVIKKLDK